MVCNVGRESGLALLAFRFENTTKCSNDQNSHRALELVFKNIEIMSSEGDYVPKNILLTGGAGMMTCCRVELPSTFSKNLCRPLDPFSHICFIVSCRLSILDHEQVSLLPMSPFFCARSIPSTTLSFMIDWTIVPAWRTSLSSMTCPISSSSRVTLPQPIWLPTS